MSAGANSPADPLELAQALIRCASVTPADAGAQAVLATSLEALGFTVTPVSYTHLDVYKRQGLHGLPALSPTISATS